MRAARLAAWVSMSMAALAASGQGGRARAGDFDAPTRGFGTLHVGVGYYDMSAKNGPSTAAFSGPAADIGFMLGYRLSWRFGAFGEVGASFSGGSSYEENGADRRIGDFVWTNSLLSAGAVHWFRSANVFVAAAASLCKVGVQDGDSRVALAQSHVGPGGFVEVGKHWRANVGTSTALRIFYGAPVQMDRGWRWQTVSVMLTVGYAYSPFWSPPPQSPSSSSSLSSSPPSPPP